MRRLVTLAMKEPIERSVEDQRLFEPSRQYWSKHVAHGSLVAQLGDLERPRRVLHLTWSDPELVLAAQQRAERDEILQKACERVGHR
jgi:hypothetical protein